MLTNTDLTDPDKQLNEWNVMCDTATATANDTDTDIDINITQEIYLFQFYLSFIDSIEAFFIIFR